jgi:outer membrane receptor protein involved in Fe transport
LFSPIFEDNPQVDDPCNFNSGVRSGPQAAQARALCVAQGIPEAEVDTYLQSTSQIDAITGGNPELTEESADTYTIGFVWTPGFAERLSFSVDYFDIEITDVIGFIDPSIVVTRCFNSGDFNQNFELDNFYCSLFGRNNVTNEIFELQENLRNLGGLKSKGADLQVDYGFDIGRFGDLRLNLVATYTDESSQQQLPGDIFIDYVGTIGQQIAEVIPDYRGNISATWNYGDFTTFLRWVYIPSMDHKETVNFESEDPDICGCTGVESANYLSLSSAWRVTEGLSVRLGVDNLTEEKPQLYTPDQDSGTNPSVYDVIGRRYFANVTYKF